MELLLLAAAVLSLIGVGLGLGLFVGFAGGLVYGRWYYNGAEMNGSWRSEVVRRWSPLHLIAFVCHYQLTVEEPGENVPTLYACGPHGILALSAALTFLTGKIPKTRLAVHSILFAIPIVRELLLLHGAIDVSEEAILAALARGESVAVVTGGVREMGLPVAPFRSSVPGIVRIARDYAVPLRQVFFGGEDELFWIWQGEWRWVTTIRRWLYGFIRYPFPTVFFPRRIRPRLQTYVSKPVDSNTDVKQAREAFIASIQGK